MTLSPALPLSHSLSHATSSFAANLASGHSLHLPHSFALHAKILPTIKQVVLAGFFAVSCTSSSPSPTSSLSSSSSSSASHRESRGVVCHLATFSIMRLRFCLRFGYLCSSGFVLLTQQHTYTHVCMYMCVLFMHVLVGISCELFTTLALGKVLLIKLEVIDVELRMKISTYYVVYGTEDE